MACKNWKRPIQLLLLVVILISGWKGELDIKTSQCNKYYLLNVLSMNIIAILHVHENEYGI